MRAPRSEAGFTLVELLVAAVIGMILVGAVYQVLVTNQRVSAVQQAQVAGHQTVRAGVDLLSQELREVSAGGGDLLVMTSDSVAFRALRAFGVVCLEPESPSFAVRVWTSGRPFTEGMSVYVFAEGDPETTADDAWFRVPIWGVTAPGSRTCGPDDDIPAQRIFLMGLSDVQLSRIRTGAPVRSWDRVRYGIGTVAGEPYLVRQVAGVDATPVPLVGPLAGPGGVAFTYLDAAGNETADPAAVARVTVTLRTASAATTMDGRVVADSLTTTVFLRN